MKRLIVTVAAVLAGCATSSGIQSMGGDRYSITTGASPGRGGSSASKRAAYEEAAAACEKRGRQVVTVSETTNRPTFTDGMHSTELIFDCSPK